MDDLDLGATLKGFAPGQKVFNRYTLQNILGRGGMGVVWLARDEELERAVALKFLPEIVALDPEALSDLKRETRRNLDLTHPHIVRIYDFVADSRTAAISMEYVNGASLSALKLEKPGRVFSVAEITPWLEQLGAALTYAHTKAKIVHRDLKPANLMIARGGDLKITDFGIARGISDSVSRVSAQLGGSSGTPVYMSPQQMMGERAAVTDDIYAIGATLYELLTGKPPFHSGNIIIQVQSKVPPTLAERRAELGVTGDAIPAAWETAIAACLAKDPEQRPASVAALTAQLGLGHHGALPPPPVPAPATAPAPAPAMPPPLAAPAPVPAPAAPAAKPVSRPLLWARRWLLPALVAALFPALACAMFLIGWRGYSWAYWFYDGGLPLLIALPVLTVAFIGWIAIARLLTETRRRLAVAIGTLACGAAAAFVLYLLADSRVVGYLGLPADHWDVFAAEIAFAAGAGVLVGYAALWWLHRLAFGGVGWGIVQATAGLFASVFIFGFHLPNRFVQTFSDEQTRLYQAQLERELQERRLKAPDLIREAHRMVFDRAPDAALLARLTEQLVQSPAWDAARLRQELRNSPEGRKGGRLLVPEEFSTIAAAIRAAVPGNAVHVAPGVYRESLFLNKAVNLIGAGRDRVTVETTPDWNALSVSKVNGVTVRGITFRHSATVDLETRTYLVNLAESSLVFEDNAVISGNGVGLNVQGGGFVTVRRNLFRDSRWSGLTLQTGVSGQISDNVFERNQVGINVNGVPGRLEITGNDVRANQRNGIWVKEGDNLTLNQNRVTGNGTAGQNYGGIGIARGRPVLKDNVAADNFGAGIWWNKEAQPTFGRGNLSDGKDPATP